MQMNSGWRHPDSIPTKTAIRKRKKKKPVGTGMIFHPVYGYDDQRHHHNLGDGGDDFGGGCVGGGCGGGGCGGCRG